MNRLMLRSLTLLALSAPGRAIPGAPGGPVIYKANCASCHRAKGQGSIGPSLSDAATWTSAVFSRSLLKGLDDHGKAFKALQAYLKTRFRW